jgi:hypothetical protein
LDRGGPDADALGSRGDLPDQHRRLRAGHRDEVVLGDPVAFVAPLLGVLSEVDGVAQRGSGIAAFADRREVEDRQRDIHQRALAYRFSAIGNPSRSRSVSPSV